MAGPGGHGGGRGGRYLTEEEKAAAPKVTKELILRIFQLLQLWVLESKLKIILTNRI